MRFHSPLRSRTSALLRRLGGLALLLFVAALTVVGGTQSAAAAESTQQTGKAGCPEGETVSIESMEVRQGAAARVAFEVSEGCGGVQLTFATYEANQPEFDATQKQTLYRHVTRRFQPGTHTLSLPTPNCYYQVDLVYGKVIETVGPGNFYEWRVIGHNEGGDRSCGPRAIPMAMPTTGGGGMAPAPPAAPAQLLACFSLFVVALAGGLVALRGTR
ncbi:MAG: hypothetical protein M3Q29_00825 [Chloroflexota bacterium]|nr:hypothetical protein [Chloroflexota bacterium]